VVRIPESTITRAEDILSKHLASYGPNGAEGGGLKLIGGDQWWRIRGRELEGEWIEVSFMPNSRRGADLGRCKKITLDVHPSTILIKVQKSRNILIYIHINPLERILRAA
jgi:hypothetical protein